MALPVLDPNGKARAVSLALPNRDRRSASFMHKVDFLSRSAEVGSFRPRLRSMNLFNIGKRQAQHALKGEIGGQITDVRLAHILARASILQADIGNARKARRLTEQDAGALWDQAARVTRDANTLTSQQGFLSAAEGATYGRELDAIAVRICGSVTS